MTRALGPEGLTYVFVDEFWEHLSSFASEGGVLHPLMLERHEVPFFVFVVEVPFEAV